MSQDKINEAHMSKSDDKVDEAFEQFYSNTYGHLHYRVFDADERYDIARAAFASGRAAEQERCLRAVEATRATVYGDVDADWMRNHIAACIRGGEAEEGNDDK